MQCDNRQCTLNTEAHFYLQQVNWDDNILLENEFALFKRFKSDYAAWLQLCDCYYFRLLLYILRQFLLACYVADGMDNKANGSVETKR